MYPITGPGSPGHALPPRVSGDESSSNADGKKSAPPMKGPKGKKK